MNPRRAAEWQIAFWSVFLAAFICAGALPLESMKRQRRVTARGPNSSTDTTLESELGVTDASRRIAECLRDVPADSPVALIYRRNSFDGFSAQLISRLVWPRRIVGDDESLASDTVPAFVIGAVTTGGFRESIALSPSLRFGSLQRIPLTQ